MAEGEAHGNAGLPRVYLDPEAKSRLRAFALEFAEPIQHLADELAHRITNDPSLVEALRRASISELQVAVAVRDWIARVLTGTESDDASLHRESSASFASFFRPLLLAGTHWECLARGLAWIRRELIRYCASDLETLPALVAAFDLECDRLSELRERDSSERIATLERLAEIGQLVASVGHELRNPLGAIETSAYLLSQRLSGLTTSDPGVARHLDKIRRQVAKANTVSTALLQLARQKPPCCSSVLLGPALHAVLEDLVHPTSVQIEIEVADSLAVWADQEQLQVVLHNLLANAVESVGAAGLIRVSASGSGSGTTLVISDNGPGIAPEDQLRVFQLLYTNKRGGTGLGLPLCQRIALAHGGSLTLESRLHGAAFRLWLPDCGQGAASPASASEVR